MNDTNVDYLDMYIQFNGFEKEEGYISVDLS